MTIEVIRRYSEIGQDPKAEAADFLKGAAGHVAFAPVFERIDSETLSNLADPADLISCLRENSSPEEFGQIVSLIERWTTDSESKARNSGPMREVLRGALLENLVKA